MAEENKAKTKVLDFTGVKDRGNYNPRRVKAGPYKGKITGVVETQSNKDDGEMWVYELKLAKSGSGVYPYYCKLEKNSLWKIRNLFSAAGVKVPKKKLKVDPSKIVGAEVGVEMEDDEYEGKPKSVIADVFPVSELDDDSLSDSSEDDEEVEDDEDEDEEEDEDTEEVDDEELEEIEIDEV